MMLHGSLVEQLLVLAQGNGVIVEFRSFLRQGTFGFHPRLRGAKMYRDVGQVGILADDHVFQVMESAEPIQILYENSLYLGAFTCLNMRKVCKNPSRIINRRIDFLD